MNFYKRQSAGADRVMLDNFLDDMRLAVALNRGRAELEASGISLRQRCEALPTPA